jgi:hypothetical protein
MLNRGSLLRSAWHPNALSRVSGYAADHSAFMEKGCSHQVRDYGRLEPGSGSCAVRFKVVSFGMSVQAALETPRFTKPAFGDVM